MTNPLYFRFPFAVSGDRTTIAQTGSADGPINYTYGYGADYSLPRDTDPAALNVERVKMNQLLYDITSNIQQYQQYGTPWFIASADNGGSPFSYTKNARVRYDNGTTIETYVSLINSNTDLPTVTASWTKLINDPASLSLGNIFTAAQTINAAGIPLVINSTNSTSGKISFKDNGTQRGTIGSTSAHTLIAYMSGGSPAGGWDSSGNLVPGAASTFDLGLIGNPYRNVYADTINLTPIVSRPAAVGLYSPSAFNIALVAQGADVFRAAGSSTGVNYIKVINADSGLFPQILTEGGDTNIPLDIRPKGAGPTNIYVNGGKSLVANYYSGSGTIVNYIQTSGTGSVFPAIIEAIGPGTDVSLVLGAQGAGAIGFQTNGPLQNFAAAQQLLVTHTASANRCVSITGSNGGAPLISTTGGDLALNSTTGYIQFAGGNSAAANGSVATVLGSVGPSGSHTTVQEWLAVKMPSGNIRYFAGF